MTIEVSPNPDGGYLEVVARASVVDREFLSKVIEQVDRELAQFRKPVSRILLVVDAPAARMSVFDSVELWQQALARKLRAFRVAYVVMGRPMSMQTRFVTSLAQRQGISLRFFEDRVEALAWLTGEAGRRLA